MSNLLTDLGNSMQAASKTLEGDSHPDRNAQFEHINAKVKGFQKRGEPVISVDTKTKENVGEFKNAGRELAARRSPRPVADSRRDDREADRLDQDPERTHRHCAD